MDPVLAFEEAVSVFTLDHDGGAFDSGLIAVQIVHHLDLVTVTVGPHVVHAIEHGGPVLRLGAARAGVEGEDGVVRVILAGQQRLQTHGFELLFKGLELALQLFEHGVVVLLERHLADREHIVVLRAQTIIFLDLVFQGADALLDLLAVFCVVPEALLRALLLQLFNLVARLVELERRAKLVERLAHIRELVFVFFKLDQQNTFTTFS